MGKAPQNGAVKSNLAIRVTYLFIKEAEISDLWKLDLIGNHDPIEKKTKEQVQCDYLDVKALNRRMRFCKIYARALKAFSLGISWDACASWKAKGQLPRSEDGRSCHRR